MIMTSSSSIFVLFCYHRKVASFVVGLEELGDSFDGRCVHCGDSDEMLCVAERCIYIYIYMCRKSHTVICCDTNNLVVVGCRWTLPNWMKRIMKG